MDQRRGLALVCVAGVIWGTIGPVVGIVDDRSSLSVWTVGAYRAVAAVAALLLMVTVAGRWAGCRQLVAARPLRSAAVGALTASFMVLFFVSVVSVGVSIATVVALGWAPVLLLLLGVVRERRPPSVTQTLTVCAGVVGLLLISVAGGGDPDPSRPVLGVVTALGSGTAYAVSADVGRPLSTGHDALTVATVTMAVAAVVLVVGGLAVATSRGETLVTTDATTWLLVLYLGVGTMALAYVLLFAGLRTTPSRTAVVATLLEPVTAVVIAVLLLGEHLTPAGGLGALLIVAAIGSLGLRPSTPVPQ